MTKRELIDAISTANRSATRDFLAEFSERELTDYMRQLTGPSSLPVDYDVRSDPSTGDRGRVATN